MRHAILPQRSAVSVLALRPMAMALFEKYRVNPWRPPRITLEEACRNRRLAWSHFAAEFEALPMPARDTDWPRRPVYFIVDYLNRENRDFAKECTLTFDASAEAEFNAVLQEYLREEREFLFPKILRYRATLLGQNVDPELESGSIRKFVQVRHLGNDRRLKALLDGLREQSSANRNPLLFQSTGRSWAENFLDRVNDHMRLESEFLYPMAMEIEKTLYDHRIAGTKTSPRRFENQALVFARAH